MITRMTASITIIGLALLLLQGAELHAAVGCSLNDPDRDVKRIFPNSTGYRSQFITIAERDGQALLAQVEAKLGDKLDAEYESIDVPYAYYYVLNGKDVIGYVHGVNAKGMFGGMQVILATNLDGQIVNMYYQKLSSPESRSFRDKAFTDQFVGLSLSDFLHHDAMQGASCPEDKVATIKDPSKNSHDDFLATIRAIKKNLILLDAFILSAKGGQSNQMQKGEKR
ncbi:MAG: hypothetical protein JW759_09115 [Candidatus Coatesbacteria bacterium]|nr:hypothetical protein [Candidatus Coatesbacteria bacterium]